jgi:alpha-1,6-mannosyltransferase
MQRGLLFKFFFALAAELFFFAALNFFDDWTLESMPIKFVESAFLAGIAYLVAVSSFKIDIGVRKQAIIFWGIAVALRLIALPLVPGDDLWRDQWEGRIQRAGFNPYLIAPDDPKLDELRRAYPESSKINHPELRAPYPPGAELLFRVFTRISDRPLFYKMVFAIADLATVALVLRLIRNSKTPVVGRARPPGAPKIDVPAVLPSHPPGSQELAPPAYTAAAWYAWNPLVAYSFAGAAHFDSLMILPMVGGIFCLVRSTTETQSRRQWFWALGVAILFGIAISIALVPALLLLLCVFALRWRAIVLTISAAIPAFLSLPFGFPTVRIWDSLGQFAYFTRLNDLFWWLIEETFWANPHQRNFHYNVILISCVVAVSFFFIRDWKRGTLWVLGTTLLLTPVLHAWYCVWILPLATWRRANAWHVLSITIFAYYLFWDERLFGLPWHAELWMRALIIAPVLAALIMLSAPRWIGRSAGDAAS